MIVKRSKSSRGFTLVELLAVIAIIGLLIGILVPATSHVRTAAKKTGSKSTLAAIQTAMETFKADSEFGGAYPPSRSDNEDDVGEVASPYVRPGTRGWIEDMPGAGLLVWGLAGADFLGCPGFKTFRDRSEYWSHDTDNSPTHATFGGPSGAYGFNEDTGEPGHPRAGVYVNLDKVRTSTAIGDSDSRVPTGGTRFAIGAEVKAQTDSDLELRDYPMFLDGFGYPILYYRADRAGRKMIDQDPFDRNLKPENRGIYHWADNKTLVSNAINNDQPLLLKRSEPEHALGGASGLQYPRGDDDIEDILTNESYFGGTLTRYIMDKNVRAKLTPQNPTSYLLITPGPDAIYGTADDITNFSPNGK